MADYDWLVTWDRQRDAIEPDALAAISAAVGGADPTQISAAVNDYLTANPPTGDTGDYASALPAGLGWLGPAITPTILEGGLSGSAGITPEVMFDSFSTARTSPGATFYVSTTGLDTNDGLTAGTPFRGLQKAVQAANAAAVPTRVYVAAGTYERSRSLYYASVKPAVDMAWIASGGRVNTGTFDLLTPPADATYTSTYSAAVANCDRVLDTASLNEWGNYRELVQVDTAAQCDKIAGTWALVAGTLYIHRADEKPVTPINTRVYRNQPNNLLVDAPINWWMQGFDLEGAPGASVAHFTMGAGAAAAPARAAVLVDSSFCYGGGAIGTATTGLGVNSWNGLVAAFGCRFDANATDGFNVHDTYGVSRPESLTVNCVGRDNGRGSAQSCNGLTMHESVRHVDVVGRWEGNRGGSVRNINGSKAYLLGSVVRNDKGDVGVGGAVPPTAVRIDDTSTLWAERVRVEMPPGQIAWATGTGTAAIYRRNCPPVAQPDSGPGTFGTF